MGSHSNYLWTVHDTTDFSLASGATTGYNPFAGIESDLGADLGNFTVIRSIFVAAAENDGAASQDTSAVLVGGIVQPESAAIPPLTDNLDFHFVKALIGHGHHNELYEWEIRSGRKVRGIDERYELVFTSLGGATMNLHMVSRFLILRK